MKKTPVGQSLVKADAIEKALGTARYAADLYLPHMLHGKILASPHPHARILHIDVTRARRLPGVKAIATASDFPARLTGPHVQDMPVLARELVRFHGEPIAAVAASSPELAAEAAALIDVEFEPLSPVLDPVAALQPQAPLVHENWASYAAHGNLDRERNIASHTGLRNGDVERAFASAHRIFEHRFRTQMVHQAYTEPSACVAEWDASNRLTVWTTSKTVFGYQAQIAEALDIRQHEVRVLGMRVGGAFGGKGQVVIEPIAALLSRLSRRPVKMVLSRVEEFTMTRPRHPSVVDIRTAVDHRGFLLARHARLVYDTGAYAGLGPSVAGHGSSWVCGPYHIPNVRVDSFCVYTNKPVAGGFRGYGVPQATFAGESQITIIARELGVDPLEFRLQNLIHENDPTPAGEPISPELLRRCLEQAAAEVEWHGEAEPWRAKGIACVVKSSGSHASSAELRLLEDSTAMLVVGAIDVGQGSDTVLRQIAAAELGLPPEDVTIAGQDTDSSPWDWNTAGSRVTYTAGLAVQRAAQDARDQLLRLAAEQLEASPEDLRIEDGAIRPAGDPNREVTIPALMRVAHWQRGGPIVGRGSVATTSSRHTAVLQAEGFTAGGHRKLAVGAQAVDLKVDSESGRVTILKVASAHDVGRAVNPLALEGQVEGGVVQGLGYALSEEVGLEEGQVVSTLLGDYRVPLATEPPPIQSIIIEEAEPDGPFGAKGVGEHSLVGIAPAVADAVADACGVRIMDLPITPDKIVAKLQSSQAS